MCGDCGVSVADFNCSVVCGCVCTLVGVLATQFSFGSSGGSGVQKLSFECVDDLWEHEGVCVAGKPGLAACTGPPVAAVFVVASSADDVCPTGFVS